MTDFTSKSLPDAIQALLELNNYKVERSVKIAGGEVDLVAHSIGDPFAAPLFIEATVSYVDNTKYGLDATKFLSIQNLNKKCVCIQVSSAGFTPDVRERAKAAHVETLTYHELFEKFQRFSPYVDLILSDPVSREFEAIYEEPNFDDARGNHQATAWLTAWRDLQMEDRPNWLVILGEYGTGKTSLTRALQRRWISDFKTRPGSPLPFRIELRNFTRQFDARTLVHDFLDKNGLGHVPIDFAFSLMRNGRVILLLDGYDEMAQFLNSRERRACLTALAELASEGARGLLTSRPNYFTEEEEFNVFDALYLTLNQNRYFISADDAAYLEKERQLDELVTSYVLDRYERNLRDLDSDQTEALVRRRLKDDVDGQRVILDLLSKVFRDQSTGGQRSLGGKPVIITYLLEIIDSLKSSGLDDEAFTEYQIYKIIVDRLMLRDQQRAQMNPVRRRRCLQELAIRLSGRDISTANEALLRSLISDEFKAELSVKSADDRRAYQDELFQDLRSSSTLTRASGSGDSGWVFSHNSLREYLCLERALRQLEARDNSGINVPISSPMRSFAASMSPNVQDFAISLLSEMWPSRRSSPAIGSYLMLLWDAITNEGRDGPNRLAELLSGTSRDGLALDGVRLQGISLKALLLPDQRINGSDSEFSEVQFDGLDLRQSKFRGAIFESCSFRNCDLRQADFSGAMLIDCDLSGAQLKDANFIGLYSESSILVRSGDREATRLLKSAAVGYLRFHGAVTDVVPDLSVYQHHPKFQIVFKIMEKLSEQAGRQYHGLTQRGEAQQDPPFARSLVEVLRKAGVVNVDGREMVLPTADGRQVISRFLAGGELPEVIKRVLA